MRVIGTPHQGFDAYVLDELGADPVELESGAALTTPILARLQLHQIAEAVFILEIHPIEGVGKPADAALAQTDAEVRVAFEHAGADDRGDDVDQVHLKAGNAGELRGPAGLTGSHLARPRRGRREGMEVERQ